MKASVQYNDFKGTVAADITDVYNNILQDYLIKTYDNYDSDRYFCQGCRIWISGQSLKVHYSLCFICHDNVENKFVQVRPNVHLEADNIFSLFKRFEIVLGKNIDSIELDESEIVEINNHKVDI